MNARQAIHVVPRRALQPGAGLLLPASPGAERSCRGLPTRRRKALAAAATLGTPLAAWAQQCQPTWSGFNQTQQAASVVVHDEDGPGPTPAALYLAGGVRVSIGGTDCYNVVRFDGWEWYTTGAGLDVRPRGAPPAEELLDAQGSSNPQLRGLYAGGVLTWSGERRLSQGIARWSAARWNSVGAGVGRGGLHSFGLFAESPQGSLEALFASGTFSGINGDPRFNQGIARWDGSVWSGVGGGLMTFTGGRGYANAFATFDEDGPGPAPPVLIVSGSFSYAGGVETEGIIRWDGQTWSTLGNGWLRGDGRALAVFDEDGAGPLPPALFVGGGFTDIGTRNNWWLPTPGGLARWDGTNWSAVAGAGGGVILAMTPFDDDGPGPNLLSLFITGFTMWPNGQNHNAIARWDGLNWYPLGSGLSSAGRALCAFDEDGPGPNPGGLYVGGDFVFAGGVYSPGFARWGCPLPPRCEADCDTSTGRGTLDAFDFLCYLNRYDARDPWACDCDVSTGARACDLFDFLCFQNAFAAGCP